PARGAGTRKSPSPNKATLRVAQVTPAGGAANRKKTSNNNSICARRSTGCARRRCQNL
ncbi:hypothetical protein A2U01_0096012, partial [Trifolium medium]|nr:hypothetical protein [Trifolium medium]